MYNGASGKRMVAWGGGGLAAALGDLDFFGKRRNELLKGKKILNTTQNFLRVSNSSVALAHRPFLACRLDAVVVDDTNNLSLIVSKCSATRYKESTYFAICCVVSSSTPSLIIPSYHQINTHIISNAWR